MIRLKYLSECKWIVIGDPGPSHLKAYVLHKLPKSPMMPQFVDWSRSTEQTRAICCQRLLSVRYSGIWPVHDPNAIRHGTRRRSRSPPTSHKAGEENRRHGGTSVLLDLSDFILWFKYYCLWTDPSHKHGWNLSLSAPEASIPHGCRGSETHRTPFSGRKFQIYRQLLLLFVVHYEPWNVIINNVRKSAAPHHPPFIILAQVSHYNKSLNLDKNFQLIMSDCRQNVPLRSVLWFLNQVFFLVMGKPSCTLKKTWIHVLFFLMMISSKIGGDWTKCYISISICSL